MSCGFPCSNLTSLLLDLGKHQLPPSSGLSKGCFFCLEHSSLLTLALLDSLQTRKCCFRSLKALRHREIALTCKVDLFLVLDQILSSCVLWVTLPSLKINLLIRKTELKISAAPHPQRSQRIACYCSKNMHQRAQGTIFGNLHENLSITQPKAPS